MRMKHKIFSGAYFERQSHKKKKEEEQKVALVKVCKFCYIRYSSQGGSL